MGGTNQGSGETSKPTTSKSHYRMTDDLKLKQIHMKKLKRFWVIPNEAAVTTKSMALEDALPDGELSKTESSAIASCSIEFLGF